ncbi:DUF3592 domain-containing protein [Streptomyces sp. NPDC048659]|uniref:DUF3592 domain-containing protein n=1 Tax=Streptomyces sp. NPDC048659 TaxID=3155489 RepID=UPI0034299342
MSTVWQFVLTAWCALCAAVALVGYARSLAGVTAAQRAVRVTGRIDRVTPPRHGSSGREGISVVVTFQDPETGQEFTVTNEGDRGDLIRAAWRGREVGLRYPPGRPHAYRFVNDLQEGRSGLGLPHTALFFLYAGLVTAAALAWGWPWALIGAGVPWSFCAVLYLPGNRRVTRERAAALASLAPVPGRIFAVLTDITVDEDGDTVTHHRPVVAFTTHDGTEITAYWPDGVREPHRLKSEEGRARSGAKGPAGALGRTFPIHYRPDNPAVFTPDFQGEHRARRTDFGCSAFAILLGLAALVIGGIALAS